MAVTEAELALYVGADQAEYQQLLADALAEAQQLVTDFVGSYQVPAVLLDLAVKETASDLFYRRNAPGGVVNAQFQGLGEQTQPVRLRADPMAGTYRYLRRYVPPWPKASSG